MSDHPVEQGPGPRRVGCPQSYTLVWVQTAPLAWRLSGWPFLHPLELTDSSSERNRSVCVCAGIGRESCGDGRPRTRPAQGPGGHLSEWKAEAMARRHTCAAQTVRVCSSLTPDFVTSLSTRDKGWAAWAARARGVVVLRKEARLGVIDHSHAWKRCFRVAPR